MPKIKEGYRIAYDVYQTPGSTEEEATYHVRRISMTMSSRFLRDHIEENTIISAGLYELLMETLKKEIPEQLLHGRDLHIEGLGTFYLKIGLKQKSVTKPSAITANDLQIEGIGFKPDREFNDTVRHAVVHFVREEQRHSEEVTMADIIVRLTDYCRQHGPFTVRTLCALFGLTKYKASRVANQLVAGPAAKFTRQREGNTYFYRRVGI